MRCSSTAVGLPKKITYNSTARFLRPRREGQQQPAALPTHPRQRAPRARAQPAPAACAIHASASGHPRAAASPRPSRPPSRSSQPASRVRVHSLRHLPCAALLRLQHPSGTAFRSPRARESAFSSRSCQRGERGPLRGCRGRGLQPPPRAPTRSAAPAKPPYAAPRFFWAV